MKLCALQQARLLLWRTFSMSEMCCVALYVLYKREDITLIVWINVITVFMDKRNYSVCVCG